MSDISYYKRLNARLNSTHKVLDWLTVGQTLAYTHSKSQGVNANDEFGWTLSSAINLDPITPLVVTDWSKVDPAYYPSASPLVRDANGNPFGISQYVGQEMTNPLAFRQIQQGKYNWSDDFIANAYLEAKFLKHFTFKPSINGKMAYWDSKGLH